VGASDSKARGDVGLGPSTPEGTGGQIEGFPEAASGEELVEFLERGVERTSTSTEHSSLLTWPGRATIG
jgi:hypothetical protein